MPNIWAFTALSICPIASKFWKVASNFCQMLSKPSRKSQRFDFFDKMPKFGQIKSNWFKLKTFIFYNRVPSRGMFIFRFKTGWAFHSEFEFRKILPKLLLCCDRIDSLNQKENRFSIFPFLHFLWAPFLSLSLSYTHIHTHINLCRYRQFLSRLFLPISSIYLSPIHT